jgi:hypothetical protein
MQSMEKNRAEIINKFREISRQFKVPFWDYSDSPLSKQQSLFNNSQHLNAEGAKAFSIDLARRLAESGLPSAE